MVTYPGHLIVFIYNSEIFCADKDYFATIIGPVYTHVFTIQYSIHISRLNLMRNILIIQRTRDPSTGRCPLLDILPTLT